MNKTKEYLIKTQSVRMNIPIKVIEEVVNFQFEEATKALQTEKTVEISGLGKFIFNQKKANKRYQKELSKLKLFTEMLDISDISDRKKSSLEHKIANTKRDIELLKNQIEHGTELFADSGGVEEQVDSSKADEGNNREDFSAEKSDM